MEDQVPQLLKLCLIPRWWRVQLVFPCPQVRHPVVHLFLGVSRELPARDTWGGLRPGISRPGLPPEIDVRGGVLVLPYSRFLCLEVTISEVLHAEPPVVMVDADDLATFHNTFGIFRHARPDVAAPFWI